MENRLPNFIIIGAAKAGTTSLYAYLKEHPQIFMSPIKETNFFAYDGKHTRNFLGRKVRTAFPVKTIEKYQDLFSDAKEQLILGEASPIYLESPIAANRIKNLLPGARLLTSLRNPADRAYSGYLTAVRHGGERPMNIVQALDKSSHYVQAGFYHDKLIRYYNLFPREQIKVCLHDDLNQDTLSVVRDIFDYLGVQKTFAPNIEVRHNVGGSVPKSFLLSKLFRGLRKVQCNQSVRGLFPTKVINLFRLVQRKNLSRNIEFPVDLRKRLALFYREDILKVQDLIQRDLSAWLLS